MSYQPPTPDDLESLKARLGFTGDQMADLFGVAGSRQWRKYTGGEAPRQMSEQMLFFGAAKLAGIDQEAVRAKIRELGAMLLA